MAGPIYCETGHPWHGIAEPVNFFTNAFAILAGIAATVLLLRSNQRRDLGLWVLVAMLYGVGVGSALWHGLRTQLTLMLDTAPGLMFLLVLVGLWIGRLYGRLAGWLAPFALLAACFGSIVLFLKLFGPLPESLSPLRFASGFIPIILTAIWMVVATERRGEKAAAVAGAGAFVSALIAAAARSTDLVVCPYTPFGSHFLWHFFLSFAAYLGIVTMVRLKRAAA